MPVLRTTFLFLFVFIFATPQARAQSTGIFITASYLYEICSSDKDGIEKVEGGHTACQAYITGVLDYHNMLRTLGTVPSIDICVPTSVKASDLQEVVWTYLDKNPQHDAFSGAPAVTLALAEVFKCKKKR